MSPDDLPDVSLEPMKKEEFAFVLFSLRSWLSIGFSVSVAGLKTELELLTFAGLTGVELGALKADPKEGNLKVAGKAAPPREKVLLAFSSLATVGLLTPKEGGGGSFLEDNDDEVSEPPKEKGAPAVAPLEGVTVKPKVGPDFDVGGAKAELVPEEEVDVKFPKVKAESEPEEAVAVLLLLLLMPNLN